MIVDYCQTARNREMEPPLTDRSMCQGTASIEPFNEFLNVNGPLQLGGVKHKILTTYDWKFAHTRKGFTGCIKNVIHNSQVSYLNKYSSIVKHEKTEPLGTEKNHCFDKFSS